MSGDYSRQRFEPAKHFSAVLMQQGRIQLDADWNEQGAILDRRWRAETTDLIGRCGVPKETPDGFKIVAAGDTFTIGLGRIYVDGLLVENHGQGPVTFDQVLAELRGTTAAPYAQQPYFPNPPQLLPGRHLVYLDVWQREVTALADPTLIEPAVGTDSTARLQTVWQVKVLPNIGEGVTSTTPDADIPGWSAVLQPSAGRLSTTADGVSGVPEDPCLLPPGGGYTGVENQLYRVEIHDGGPLGLATFTWSRDNATVATQVLAIPAPDRLVVDSTGRDAVLRFNIGDWVEITDNERELQGLPGEMLRLQAVDDATRTLLLEQPLPAGVFAINEQGRTDPARHTRVRRWDQGGKVLDTNGNLLVDLDDPSQPRVIPIPSGAGTSIIIEHGVRIAFDTASPDSPFRTGDYWVFATRTADASVERLEQAPARGIHHHFCRLALIEVSDDHQVTVSADCRQIFPHGLLASTTGEVLFEAAPVGQEVVSGPIDTGLGSGPVCVVLGMAQMPVQTQNPVIMLGHNAQALLTADIESPSGLLQVRAVRQGQSSGALPMLVHWWAFRPERHLGQVVVAPGVSVSIAPAQPIISAGGQQQFTATVTGTTNTAVTWSVTGGGTISPTGLYRAPASVSAPTAVTVTATSVADTTRSATTTVTILPQITVVVEPPTATALVGAQQQFTATVTGTTDTRVSWSVNGIRGGNTTLGTISAAGLYQAPGAVPTPPVVTVTATSVADDTKSATATLTVEPQVSVAIAPTNVTVTSGTQQQFTAFVSGTDNPAVTWSVTGPGSISQTGLYQAPAVSTSASATVTATSQADPSKSATAAVTILPQVSVTVSPTSAEVRLGATQQFTATVNGTSNKAVIWRDTGLGTIDQNGFYRAPTVVSTTATTPLTLTVRATSRADSRQSGSATVTIPAVSVSVSPPSADLSQDEQLQFSASVENAADTRVTWRVQEGGNGGSITSTGLYTAPRRPGIFHATATSVADGAKRATVSITVGTT